MLSAAADSVVPMGNGHINDTYLICCHDGCKYTLQRINKYVFPCVKELMENIDKVTSYLCNTYCDNDTKCMRVVTTTDGNLYSEVDGEYWRVLTYIDGCKTVEQVETPSDFYYAARAFGRFAKQMSGFDASTLFDVIPGFHDTAARYKHFEDVLLKDSAARAENVIKEIELIKSRKADTHIVTDLLSSGALPLRVTHNDTKINNVMLDKITGFPRAVIDLDTVMCGSILYDYGDSIRSGANTAAEDEQDTDKASLDLELFEEFSKGYLYECKDMLCEKEKELLPFSVKLLALELGMRFLDDYLSGDLYFKTDYPEHNLYRARTQLRLMTDVEAKEAVMAEIVSRYTA